MSPSTPARGLAKPDPGVWKGKRGFAGHRLAKPLLPKMQCVSPVLELGGCSMANPGQSLRPPSVCTGSDGRGPRNFRMREFRPAPPRYVW